MDPKSKCEVENTFLEQNFFFSRLWVKITKQRTPDHSGKTGSKSVFPGNAVGKAEADKALFDRA